MNEQLENAIERGGDQAKIFEEAVNPNAAEKAAEEKAEETTGQEENMNHASPTEEAENASAAGLSDALPQSAELTAPSGREPESPPSLRDVREPCLEQGAHEVGEGVPTRDYYAEWQELAEAHPEVVGKELPEDIYQACMRSALPPLRVYESMMLQKQNEQIIALQQEIATLRQNAENTARAPVVAAAEGPANEPEDLFMKGFNSY